MDQDRLPPEDDRAAQAEHLLQLAAERGLLPQDELANTLAELRSSATGSSDSVLRRLIQSGLIDGATIARLAREVGMAPPPPRAPSPEGLPRSSVSVPLDPFDGPPVSGWDRYEILEFIGRGGMGDVYKARDPRLGRFVALKFLRRDDPVILQRFTREAQVQARIDHDNVCPVYEVGEIQGLPYIAMQYVSGGSIKEAADLLSIPEKVGIMVDVADALHAAHQAGLVHRDVKPANILLERAEEGRWRPFVVDFGIARDLDSQEVTASGMVLGTPAFSSPEQVRGETHRLDRRTDVYSLGATLYWFLTGKSPYEGSYPEIVSGIAQREPEPPHRSNPEVGVDLETIVLKCLEKEPDRRYPTARAVSEDLRRFLAGEPIEARRAGILYRLGKRIRKHRALAITSLIAIAAFLILAAVSTRSNLRARRQAAVAQRLVEQVKEIESASRVAAMLPRGDRRPQRDAIRQRVEALSQSMAAMDAAAVGPGHYALGRGYHALGELEPALDHLRRAEAAGYRTPAVSYSLGLVLGGLYERALLEARQIDDPLARQAELESLQRGLRREALENLRQADRLSGESPAYVEGLIAFYEERFDSALAKAREAFSSSGWLWEARKLEGDILVETGTRLALRGEHDRALTDFERAGLAYREAADIARSAAPVYVGDCERWVRVMETRVRLGESGDEAFTGGESACHKALEVDPDRARSHEVLALLHGRRADHLLDAGRDATSALDLAVAAARRATALDSASATAQHVLGSVLTVVGMAELAAGADPRPQLEEAIAALERAVELRPRFLLAHDDLGYAYERLARHEMSVGDDPRTELGRAIASFEQAIALGPGYANAHNNLGISFWRRALASYRLGEDPIPDLDRSVACYDQALALNPAYAYAYANLGLAHRTRAMVLLEQGADPTARLELARAALDRALELNPRIHWAHLEKAAAEVLAVRWSLRTGEDLAERHLAAAAAAAARARTLNPRSSAAFQTTAEVHRWHAEWLQQRGRPARTEIEAGRRAVERALELNPGAANAELTAAGLRIVAARGEPDPRLRQALLDEAERALDRAVARNRLLARDVAALGEETRGLR